MLLDQLNIERMRERRLELGLSLSEAARRAKLPDATKWQLIEKGGAREITIQTLGRIAHALRLRPDKLLKTSTAPASEPQTRAKTLPPTPA